MSYEGFCHVLTVRFGRQVEAKVYTTHPVIRSHVFPLFRKREKRKQSWIWQSQLVKWFLRWKKNKKNKKQKQNPKTPDIHQTKSSTDYTSLSRSIRDQSASNNERSLKEARGGIYLFSK